ncbi:aspartate-semialdehyde dehydrogenase [Lentilactobacillus kefiri]|uniref:Aspartate-semialdehyde dehydrogenase n=2 Tax=Lentilactobacillus kefiri TaxID=33962 RepID=A0A8E1RLF1_LENKE|nr:aspartate-semialdehyde dehydrogenase [Lentilactobacillus kefiri]KRL70042.1 aspartate-semialdehyde dehydrogenase [Lentilactobacillus parakefiri DSM 10551]KRM54002.1 aspartate-semialdehyde dehydrogenase [Lentilactobacillus kefiri DSM 20587 = JCM 5818]MCJ2160853.1 aspartate-semialdehyde dehydrogenase [Lentilactobacillus kefiri]MCP9368470.1 aspartate-semialdehyde dehydrogenase [Lentilactobacillus kefiri]MDH5107898.1 aspartate-semialdehyde dehydrogenase [Lentilactobacillus kefiri]
MKEFNVAILGATGAVGTRMIQQLEQSTIPVKSVKLLASSRSAGKVLKFRGEDHTVEETTPDSFNGIDLVLSSAGGSTSKKFLPEAVKRGAVCVDNTSAFRMEKEVPLVIPEVNEKALYNHRGIIANPNCSTIQMVVCLEPIYKKFGLKQVIVSTYQAVSGAGQSALDELMEESKQVLNGEPTDPKILPTKGDKKHYQMAFNLLPQIDVFESDGYYTHEEWKMIHETKKIMLDDMDAKDIKVTATCVRAPIRIAHGESVYFEVADKTATADQIKAALDGADGVVLQDDPAHQIYPQSIEAEGKRETFVGRVRPDFENEGAFNMWVVSDNLLKGAAWNAVQIAEHLVADDLVRVPDNPYLG